MALVEPARCYADRPARISQLRAAAPVGNEWRGGSARSNCRLNSNKPAAPQPNHQPTNGGRNANEGINGDEKGKSDTEEKNDIEGNP